VLVHFNSRTVVMEQGQGQASLVASEPARKHASKRRASQPASKQGPRQPAGKQACLELFEQAQAAGQKASKQAAKASRAARKQASKQASLASQELAASKPGSNKI
jgi:hypothetical protein